MLFRCSIRAACGHQVTKSIDKFSEPKQGLRTNSKERRKPLCLIHKLTALIMLTPRQQDVCVTAYVRAARAAAAAAAAALKPLKTNGPAFSVGSTAKLRRRAR